MTIISIYDVSNLKNNLKISLNEIIYPNTEEKVITAIKILYKTFM